MSKGGQGQSAITVDKERRIAAAMSVGMRIANARFGGRGYNFWHFDANAGSGWNDAVNVPGSPLVFWQISRDYLTGLYPTPFFCDFDKASIAKLKDRLADSEDSRNGSVLLPGDNEEAIEVFAECIRSNERNPEFAVGSIVVDPNGYFYRNAKTNAGAPVNALPDFCREFPRVDVILNLNCSAYLRQKGSGHNVIPPEEVFSLLGKQQWLISKPVGTSQFLLAIGRNIKTGDHKSLGLYDLNSEMGRSIVDAFKDDNRQGSLSHDLPELPRISGTSGFSGSKNGSNEKGEQPMPVRSARDRSPSPSRLPAVGNVRHSIEPATDLSSMPLFGAQQK